MKPNDLVEVECSTCNNKRQIKWSAFKHKSDGEPYRQTCGSCARKGPKSEEQKKKISKALKGVPKSQEFCDHLSEYIKANPSGNLVPGAGSGWNSGIKTGPLPEETKKKISESMKNKDKDNES